jgi:hypothetical protein
MASRDEGEKMIEGIYSNVKGPIDLQLASPYNLIFGRNGSGKSAVIHSIELGAFDTAYDAAGKDVKTKGALEALAPRGDGLFCHLTVDGEEVSWGDRSKKFDNVVAMAMRALTGSHDALVEFLLTNIDDDDHPIALDIPGWDARVKHHGSYRKALLEMMKSVGASIRSHQKRMRELAVIQEYVEDNGLESYFVDNEKDSLETQILKSKQLKAKIDKEALIFVKGSFDVVETGINRYLPEEIGRAEFVELGGKIRLSINGDVVIPSGVETVALAVALAGALLNGPRALFILPDRAYDPRTLGWLMRSLRNMLCAGVFVQTTVLPEDYDFMSLGWDLVRV